MRWSVLGAVSAAVVAVWLIYATAYPQSQGKEVLKKDGSLILASASYVASPDGSSDKGVGIAVGLVVEAKASTRPGQAISPDEETIDAVGNAEEGASLAAAPHSVSYTACDHCLGAASNEGPGAPIRTSITHYYCVYDGGYYGDGGGYCAAPAYRPHTPVSPADSARIAACGRSYQPGSYASIPNLGYVECIDSGHLASYQVDIFVYYSSEWEPIARALRGE